MGAFAKVKHQIQKGASNVRQLMSVRMPMLPLSAFPPIRAPKPAKATAENPAPSRSIQARNKIFFLAAFSAAAMSCGSSQKTTANDSYKPVASQEVRLGQYQIVDGGLYLSYESLKGDSAQVAIGTNHQTFKLSSGLRYNFSDGAAYQVDIAAPSAQALTFNVSKRPATNP